MTSSGCLSDFAWHFAEHFKSTKSSKSLSVSPVKIDGLPEIANFYGEAFKANKWFGTQLGSKSLREFFSDALMAPDLIWLKLASGDQTVGFSALIEDGDFLYSDETLISDAFRGHGIGTIYFRALCEVARQQQKPIYGDIVYSKQSRVIARIFVDEFGLVPIGFVLTQTKQQSPLAMVRIATQQSLQDLSRYEQVRLISDEVYKKNGELMEASETCTGFNCDANTPMLHDDRQLISYLLAQSDQTEVKSVASLLELIKLQIPPIG